MEITLPIIICTIVGTVIGYLLGSANFAIIVSRIMHDDIRNHGSGNAGLTNMFRTMGKWPALITLVGDFSKGIVSVIIVRLMLHFILGVDDFGLADYCAAFAALLGHNFPLYYGFKGGKGILVSFGAVMILSPLAGIICFSGFLIGTIISHYVSLGSLIAGFSFPIVANLITFIRTGRFEIHEIILATCIGGLIVFMHRANIKRLINHEEAKFSIHSKKE